MPVPWVHAFVDVPADRVDAARAFCSAVTGWPPGEPWPGHPEFVSLVPQSGAPYLHVQRIGAPPRVHLDLLGSLAGDVPRLAELGAEPGPVGDGWRVVTSPAGLPFCPCEEAWPHERPGAVACALIPRSRARSTTGRPASTRSSNLRRNPGL